MQLSVYFSDLFTSHSIAVLVTLALALVWGVSEYFGRQSTWKQGAPKHPSSRIDHGTYPFIAIGIIISLLGDILGFMSGVGGYLPVYATIAGAAVLITGVVVRGWALRTLGKFFTMPITIAKDHQIIQNGPYRWLRHPSYTGGFLIIIGVALSIGSLVGVLVTIAAGFTVYVYRIRMEETALRSHFGGAYDRYSKSTYRLFPWIY